MLVAARWRQRGGLVTRPAPPADLPATQHPITGRQARTLTTPQSEYAGTRGQR